MATVQKTTMKRYNGTDWDPVYLANSADIVYIGTGFTVAQDLTGYSIGDSVSASDATFAVLKKVVNQVATVDKVTIPTLKSGEAITALAASKLTGVVARDNLPTDVGGKGVEVASEEAKAALTKDDVNIGDIVKVTEGKVYLVTGFNTNVPTYMELTDSASQIAWSRISDKPTTLAGYGITDAVNSSEVVTSATANKILKLDADGKLPASITGDAATLGTHAASYFATQADMTAAEGRLDTAESDIDQLQTDVKNIDATWIKTGTIDIARIPAAAVETVVVVADDAARQALTTSDVQKGDTVKVNATGRMYFVVDESKLGTADWEQAYLEYSAGRASAVDWSGVENTPTTLAGYGIGDAVNSSDVVTTATANKILKLNADAKLPASITGDAATLGGHSADYFATQTAMTAVEGRMTTAEGDINALEATVGNADSGLVKDVATLQGQMSTAQTDITNLKSGEAITALAASKITGTMTRNQLPADISGRLILKTNVEAMYTLTKTDVAVGDLVKLSTGDVFVVTDVDNLDSSLGYTQIVVGGGSIQVEWSNIQNKPTTVATSGLTDALADGDVIASTAKPTAGDAGKLVPINAAGKLNTDITGDAQTLNGHADTYFATDADLGALETRVGTAEGDIDQLEADIKAIDCSWITTGTISIDRLPHGALERCVVVANDAARFALTKADVQKGDTVKVTDTGLMYFVVDDDKLSTEDGYEVYTAGRASAVDWSGVENTPTTLAGYGITDAVNSSDVVTVATANKILKLNAQGKLDADITGHVDWANINDKPTSTVAEIDEAVELATHTNRAVLDLLGVEATGDLKHLLYNNQALAYKSELDEVALGSLKVVSALPTDATTGQLVLQNI